MDNMKPKIDENNSQLWLWHGRFLLFDDWLRLNTELTDEQKVMLKLQYG
jgi:hypothetical protein